MISSVLCVRERGQEMKVIKRDGRVVLHDPSKVALAISKANREVAIEEKITDSQIKTICNKLLALGKDMMSVEEIQDFIEMALMETGKFVLAKRYIVYRYERTLLRKANSTDDTILELVRNENRELNEENSNKNTALASTERDYIAGIVSRDLTKRILLPEEIVKAHEEGAIHFHDADYFVQDIFNCCLINISDMLIHGTVMNGKLIESPKSFQVACTVMTQIIASVASNQYGGQSVNIKHLGVFVDRSRKKYQAVFQEVFEKYHCSNPEFLNYLVDIFLKTEIAAGVQTIQYQINTLMTTNGQSPFVTLFLELDKNDPYLEDTALIIEEIIKQRTTGIKNEKGVYISPAFPKLVYVLDECNCLKGGKYDYLTEMAVKCSAKRMYPDYISAKKMRENYQGNVFSPMGCRSFLSPWKDKNGECKFERF